MKLNNFVKATPFLSILLLVCFLALSNQKENTKLRLLIWDTPSFKLGTYIAFSTGAGFILSYIFTTNLIKIYKSTPKPLLKFKQKNIEEEISKVSDTPTYLSYDNTLIERDIKDPSPTVNASFRIIGKREKSNSNYINNNNSLYAESFDVEGQYDEQAANNEIINKVIPDPADWNDESFSSW